MAGAFKAGTVFIDVVPSMKGFFKDVNSTVKAQAPQSGQTAGRSFADAFTKETASASKDLVNAISDPLGKSVATLRVQAKNAGEALAAAQDTVADSEQALTTARERETRAAQKVLEAQERLNDAREHGGATSDQARNAEKNLAAAVEESKRASDEADKAAADHSRTLGEQTAKMRDADRAAGELASATGRTKREVAQAEPELRDLARALDDVDDSAVSTKESISQSGSSISGMLGMVKGAIGPLAGLTAAVGIGGFAQEAIAASDATDKFVSTLQFGGVDPKKIDALKTSTQAYADATVYDLSDIQSITAQLAANGVDGYDRLAEAAGNLNAVAGGNKDTYASVGMVLTQTAGAGKLTTENFDQLADAIPGASGKIQKALKDQGAYTGNFRDALEKGQISADEFNKAVLELGSGKAAQQAAQSTKTIEGAAGNLQATIVSGFKDLIDYVKPGLTDILTTVSDTIGKVIAWIKQNKDAVQALAIGVTVAVTAFTAFSIVKTVTTWIKATTFTMQALNAAMRANMIGIIITALAALVAALVYAYKHNESFRATVQALGAKISQIWNQNIKPALAALHQWLTTVLAPAISKFWTGTVKPVLEAVRQKASTAIGFVTDTVLPRLKDAIASAKRGFESFKDGASKALDAIRGAAAKPINFVIRSVYRDGLKKAFDTIASKVGLSLRLPTVNPIPGYASGGQFTTMTPGYTPGKDIFTFYSPDGGGALRMSGGEGIIRPDSLRALGGKAWLDRVNASHGRGLSTVGDLGSRRGQVAFADGGIWGRIRSGFGSAVNWVTSTASAVADVVSDPAGAITSLVIKPARELLASMGSSFWAQTAAKVPSLLFSAIRSAFTKGLDTAGVAGGTGMVAQARKAIGVPYVWGGSTIPPGLDCSGLVYWSANKLGLGWPRLTAAGYQAGSRSVAWSAKAPGDLLFWGNPAHHVAIYAGGNRMVEEPHTGLSGREITIYGSPTVGRYGKYDSGGWITPGMNHALNLTGEPEAVLTARQWSDVQALAARGAQQSVSLDGAQLALVVDDREGFDAHLQTVAAATARQAARAQGRSR